MTATFPRTMGYGLGSSLQRGASAFGPWVTAEPYDYPLRDQTMTTAPTFPPFKFEPRRARIDWRLLHGIDINAMVRDVDLDTLEKIVNIVAFGDIEAEDTRHLTELNFIKIFRLSQMMIEYLLYVQDCLQSSNGWLQQDRSNMDKYVQAARLRIRELEASLKMNKRELRRTRKTVKTYELLAALNEGKAAQNATTPAPTATFAATAPAPQPAPQQQVVKADPNPVNVAMEGLLRKELAALAERLSKATLECQTLRLERDDLYQGMKELEAAVKARPQGDVHSQHGYSRQNAESIQVIQGLQEQLNRATAEITKLRSEKNDLVEELDRANTDNRQLLDEKGMLLTEIAARPAELPKGGPEGDNLGTMLLEAERQKAALQDQLADSRAEITALQKELMKAMKALGVARGDMPQSQPADDKQLRELEGSVRELEGLRTALQNDLTEMRRMYNHDVQQLQEDLQATQEKLVAAERRITELRAGGTGSPTRTGGRMDSPQPGGLVKMADERRGGGYGEAQEMIDRQKDMMAEYEAVNERLNQQLFQLKDERNMLGEEVEQLRAQLQNRSPARQQQGGQGIDRDWRTEEIERLNAENEGARRRIMDLEDALRDRDAIVERLRNTIRELQAQLDDRGRRPPSMDAGPSRVKQQVKNFERMAGPAPLKSESFSFPADESAPPSGVAETPTSTAMRRAPFLEQPPRSPSPQPQSADEAAAQSPSHTPPSPKRPGQLLDPTLHSKWLRRVPRPTPTDSYTIQKTLTDQLGGFKPEALELMLQDEIRVITEHPYPYEGDEEQAFKAMMPHEMEDRPWVRSVQPHTMQDLEQALGLLKDQLLAVVDDELAHYGVDLEAEVLSDKAYVACMRELQRRRNINLSRYPAKEQERANSLREYLLTHLELAKRAHQKQLIIARQQQLQEEQRQLGPTSGYQGRPAASASASTERYPSTAPHSGSDRLPPSGPQSGSDRLPSQQGVERVASQPGVERLPSTAPVSHSSGSAAPPAGPPSSMPSSRDGPAHVSSGPATQSFSSAAAAARQPISVTGSATSGAPSQAQLPPFPPRQPSLQGSSSGSSEAGGGRGGSMSHPAPQMVRPATEVRPAAEAVQIVPSQRYPASEAATTGVSGSARFSPVGSMKDLNSEATTRTDQAQAMRTQPSRHGSSSSHSSEREASRQPSMQQTTPTVVRPPGAGGLTHVQTSQQLSSEGSQSSSPVFMGHAPPSVTVRPAGQQAAAPAPTPGGNMNMSIRSVKYQESDFDDDDDDVVPLAQPKPVRRVVEDDEYALTEDEEAQHDMGIDDSDGFSPAGPQPKILMRPPSSAGSPTRLPVPSRLGQQSTPAVAQSRGWATDEPLQAAPRPVAPPPQTETAELEELESIHSFDQNSNQSLRRPGAWGSPSSTTRKPSVQSRDVREPFHQLSRNSKQSGWNETSKSLGATSINQADEIQSIQEITGIDSFTDSRPMSRVEIAPRRPTGASQAAAPATRPVASRRSFDSELSDIEYA